MSPKIIAFWDRWQLWISVATVIATGTMAWSNLVAGQARVGAQVEEIKQDRTHVLADWTIWRMEVDRDRATSKEWRVSVDDKLNRILNKLER